MKMKLTGESEAVGGTCFYMIAQVDMFDTAEKRLLENGLFCSLFLVSGNYPCVVTPLVL